MKDNCTLPRGGEGGGQTIKDESQGRQKHYKPRGHSNPTTGNTLTTLNNDPDLFSFLTGRFDFSIKMPLINAYGQPSGGTHRPTVQS